MGIKNKFPTILLLVSVFALASQMLIGSNYAEAATVNSQIQKDAGHMTCKDDPTKLKINEFYLDAKTNDEGKWDGEFGITQESQGADLKIDEGKVTTDTYEFKSTAEDTTGNCNDEPGTKGTLKGSCGDDVSIKYESELGTVYEIKGKVTCTQ
ncbi:MAG: hypothetical protein ACPKPY_02335 [Nitrososphaeraceae archaeon]